MDMENKDFLGWLDKCPNRFEIIEKLLLYETDLRACEDLTLEEIDKLVDETGWMLVKQSLRDTKYNLVF